MTNRQKRSLATQIASLKEKGAKIYKKKDELFQQLLAAVPPGEVITTRHGPFEIVDNFAAKNVGYRPASFHRFELKEHKPLPTRPVKAARPQTEEADELP